MADQSRPQSNGTDCSDSERANARGYRNSAQLPNLLRLLRIVGRLLGVWNSWNIGVKSWEVKQRIVQPLDDRPLYICGEAYSDAQGWVEGALQTADMMLQKLGIEPLPSSRCG